MGVSYATKRGYHMGKAWLKKIKPVLTTITMPELSSKLLPKTSNSVSWFHVAKKLCFLLPLTYQLFDYSCNSKLSRNIKAGRVWRSLIDKGRCPYLKELNETHRGNHNHPRRLRWKWHCKIRKDDQSFLSRWDVHLYLHQPAK